MNDFEEELIHQLRCINANLMIINKSIKVNVPRND